MRHFCRVAPVKRGGGVGVRRQNCIRIHILIFFILKKQYKSYYVDNIIHNNSVVQDIWGVSVGFLGFLAAFRLSCTAFSLLIIR